MVPKREVSFAPINGHCKRDEAHPKSARFGSGLNLLAVPMTHRSGLGGRRFPWPFSMEAVSAPANRITSI